MQTASDASACSGEICRPDPTLPVEPEDVIQEDPLDPAFIESLAAPRSTTMSDGLLNMMVPGADFAREDDLDLLELRPRRRRTVLIAVSMALATVAGILVALGAQHHLSGPRAIPDVPDTSLGDIRLRVQRAAATAPRSAKPRTGAPRKHHRLHLSRQQRAKRHLRRAGRDYRRGRYGAARREARRALRLDRRNRQARSLERRASVKLRQRERAIKRQLSRAKRSLKRRRWKLARQQARAILRVDPRNRQARQIKRLAEARLRKRPKRG